MGQMASGNVWTYKKYTYNVTERENYDTYYSFSNKYVTPLVQDLSKYLCVIKVSNNTDNTRAGENHIECYENSQMVFKGGRRVGGSFDDAYGADFYPGATIEIYICTDFITFN